MNAMKQTRVFRTFVVGLSGWMRREGRESKNKITRSSINTSI